MRVPGKHLYSVPARPEGGPVVRPLFVAVLARQKVTACGVREEYVAVLSRLSASLLFLILVGISGCNFAKLAIADYRRICKCCIDCKTK
jgi:hypothetical protein